MDQYGLLAYPAGHSRSPALHNAAFRALKIEAEYKLFETPPEKLVEFLAFARQNLRGFSVSLPHKIAILPYLDEIDPAAAKIGAVNTVINRAGRLIGYNTDIIGAQKALEEALGDLSQHQFFIVGAGGAVPAIIEAISQKNGHILAVANRDPAKIATLNLLPSQQIALSDLQYRTKYRQFFQENKPVLIQATSIWTLEKNLTPAQIDEFFPLEYIASCSAVMDIAYTPLHTPFITSAQRSAIPAITGDKMLLYQAAAQFEIWTGHKAPIEAMNDEQ